MDMNQVEQLRERLSRLWPAAASNDEKELRAELDLLLQDYGRLQQEVQRLRQSLAKRSADPMSSRLRDALRE